MLSAYQEYLRECIELRKDLYDKDLLAQLDDLEARIRQKIEDYQSASIGMDIIELVQDVINSKQRVKAYWYDETDLPTYLQDELDDQQELKKWGKK